MDFISKNGYSKEHFLCAVIVKTIGNIEGISLYSFPIYVWTVREDEAFLGYGIECVDL